MNAIRPIRGQEYLYKLYKIIRTPLTTSRVTNTFKDFSGKILINAVEKGDKKSLN